MAYSLSQFKEVLDGLGFHLGPDGLNGNNGNILDVYTQSAIREFQYQHRLPITGRLDSATDDKAQKVMRHLQYSLNLTIDARLPVDEFYGPLTLQAVKAFQKAYGLPPTGIAALMVRQKIDQEMRKRVAASA
ncbi:peptidoglycan-binding protein [Leptothermofonsia sichuanensis E412]|uniref:peptidoglycan-binding domain-containing protein n=1 Tax=Leptothermofonsia sichuanensis TaxID=2917832 RepID=UPI001CA663F2|nr:peptidoglycan-binding protein [Leptothermofonsia sichuanensis]QZZ19368.1 peptidoglycan-binding protein [Leptothermofonsia sichuanensis E412]